MPRILLLMLTMMAAHFSFSQDSGKIAVVVNNDRKAPLENATVELRRSKDSVLVKTALTDVKGRADFDGLPFGNYYLRTSAVGYQPHYSAFISINAASPLAEVPELQMEAASVQMQAVTVTGRKPFIQKLADR